MRGTRKDCRRYALSQDNHFNFRRTSQSYICNVNDHFILFKNSPAVYLSLQKSQISTIKTLFFLKFPQKYLLEKSRQAPRPRIFDRIFHRACKFVFKVSVSKLNKPLNANSIVIELKEAGGSSDLLVHLSLRHRSPKGSGPSIVHCPSR